MTFQELLEKYNSEQLSKRDKGDKFERLMVAFLKTYKKYFFSEIWLWGDFPHKTYFVDTEIDIEKEKAKDLGIDLVARKNTGEYWVIQCKFYDENKKIDKPDVDTFLSLSSKTPEIDGEIFSFACRLFISTTNHWTDNAEKTLENQNPPVVRLNRNELENAPVLLEELEKGIHGVQARQKIYDLKDYQKDAFEAVVEYFETRDRGKLIMACGTGKTFTSLRIAEKQVRKTGNVLFLAPSISLVGQTLNEWANQAVLDINPICVCSDSSANTISKLKTLQKFLIWK
jgi:predicted helicase